MEAMARGQAWGMGVGSRFRSYVTPSTAWRLPSQAATLPGSKQLRQLRRLQLRCPWLKPSQPTAQKPEIQLCAFLNNLPTYIGV